MKSNALELITTLDTRYKDFYFSLLKIDTTTDNRDFLPGDIAMVADFQDLSNPIDYIDDGDYIVLEGGAGTANPHHVVKVHLDDQFISFEKTSDFLTELPVTKLLLKDIAKAKIYGKVLITISNKTKDSLDFWSETKPKS